MCAISVLKAGGPAGVHAPAPGGLPQAHQALCRGLSFGTAGCRARAIFEIRDARHHRRLSEEPGKRTDAAVQLQIRERIGDVSRVPECNDAARHRVADLINSRTDRRFNVFAALRVWKSLPTTPSLHHKFPSKPLKNPHQETRQLTIGSVASTAPVDKSAIKAAIYRAQDAHAIESAGEVNCRG